jgi:DNA-binding NarL/FixJ family response regulator
MRARAPCAKRMGDCRVSSHSFDEAVSPARDAEDADDPLRRFRAALHDGRLESANAIVVHSWTLLLDHHATEVRDLLETLPTDRLVKYPLLGLLLGFSCQVDPAERPRAARHLAVALRGVRPRLVFAPFPERIAIHCGESAALRQLGQVKGAISAARVAIRLLGGAADADLAQIGDVPRLYADLGWTFFEDGRSDEALVAFLRGMGGPRDDRPAARGNLASLCAMQALEGDLIAASKNLARVREAGSDQHGGGRARLHAALAGAMIDLESCDAPAAARRLEAEVPAAAESWIEQARVEAGIALVGGRPAAGLAALEREIRTRAAEGRAEYAQRRLAPIRAVLQLALGNVDAAGALLQDLGDATPQIRIGKARVELMRGRVHAALKAVRGVVADGLSPRAVAEATAVEAAVLLRLPGTARLDGALDRLGALARSTGLRLPIAFLPAADFERVRAALIERGYDDLFTGVRSVLPDVCGLELSSREVSLLRALAQPDSSRASVAARLHVSVNTVKTQLRLLYRKLGVADRETALAVALDRGLLGEDDDVSA